MKLALVLKWRNHINSLVNILAFYVAHCDREIITHSLHTHTKKKNIHKKAIFLFQHFGFLKVFACMAACALQKSSRNFSCMIHFVCDVIIVAFLQSISGLFSHLHIIFIKYANFNANINDISCVWSINLWNSIIVDLTPFLHNTNRFQNERLFFALTID